MSGNPGGGTIIIRGIGYYDVQLPSRKSTKAERKTLQAIADRSAEGYTKKDAATVRRIFKRLIDAP